MITPSTTTVMQEDPFRATRIASKQRNSSGHHSFEERMERFCYQITDALANIQSTLASLENRVNVIESTQRMHNGRELEIQALISKIDRRISSLEREIDKLNTFSQRHVHYFDNTHTTTAVRKGNNNFPPY